MTDEEKLVKIAENTPKIYEAGIEQGKKSEYDAFWDAFQNGGKPSRYDYAFAGHNWTATIFRPKYNIIALNCQYMFAYGSLEGLDMTKHLKSLGVTLDTSQSTSFDRMFYYGSPTRVPAISTVAADAITRFISYASVEVVDRFILRSDGSQQFSNTFEGAAALKSIMIEGSIGTSGFNVQSSTKLTHDSLMSIINALKDYSEDTTGTEWVLTLGSTNIAKLTEAEQLIVEQKGWILK